MQQPYMPATHEHVTSKAWLHVRSNVQIESYYFITYKKKSSALTTKNVKIDLNLLSECLLSASIKESILCTDFIFTPFYVQRFTMVTSSLFILRIWINSASVRICKLWIWIPLGVDYPLLSWESLTEQETYLPKSKKI